MENDLIEISYFKENFYLLGEIIRINHPNSFWAKIFHKGLNKSKIISSESERYLQFLISSAINSLKREWEKPFFDKQIDNFKILDILLEQFLDVKFDFDLLKDKSKYDIPNPKDNLEKRLSQISSPQLIELKQYTDKPIQIDYSYLNFFEKIIESNKIKESNDRYLLLLQFWNDRCSRIDIENNQITQANNISFSDFEIQKEKEKQKIAQEFEKWQKDRADFIFDQENHNEQIEKLKTTYKRGELSIVEYCHMILIYSEYPQSFPKTFELEYNKETKILIVEYSLPAMEDLPTLKGYKWPEYGEYKEYHATEAQMHKIFENTMYKITLRTIHELFLNDKIAAIDAISFNGWVNAINKATGKKVNNCILSIQVKKSEFLDIDLRHVDPKICFKNLKGVGSSKLSGMTPIQPIMQISKIDKRFTSHYDVADKMDDSTNLAAMDWEDFEHLIREVFGKEFSSNGGEVKVTQASRDGGVDAIAFDPDPIRGGKIIIQAKRYTNTVGVSAVRDLFGTVMNEGANKGILVTTADYGPDAYEFVKGKPLTLMNGANLLYLLEKHGHKAKIDIAEARRLML